MDKSSPPIPGCNKLKAGSIISMLWGYTIRISGMYGWFNWNMKNPRHGFPHFPPLWTMQQFYCLHWYDWRQSTTSYWPFMHPKGGSLGLGFRQAGKEGKPASWNLQIAKRVRIIKDPDLEGGAGGIWKVQTHAISWEPVVTAFFLPPASQTLHLLISNTSHWKTSKMESKYTDTRKTSTNNKWQKKNKWVSENECKTGDTSLQSMTISQILCKQYCFYTTVNGCKAALQLH
jgi:hypothetical protein